MNTVSWEERLLPRCVGEDDEAGGVVVVGRSAPCSSGWLAGAASAASGGCRAPRHHSGAQEAGKMSQGDAQHSRRKNEQDREERGVLDTP